GEAPPVNLWRECAQHGATRVVAGKARAPPPVRPEEALVDLAVVGTRERAAPLVQLGNGCRRLHAHGLDDARVAEPVALAQRVGRVLLPRVLGVARADSGVDAARREHAVGVETRPAADDDDRAP